MPEEISKTELLQIASYAASLDSSKQPNEKSEPPVARQAMRPRSKDVGHRNADRSNDDSLVSGIFWLIGGVLQTAFLFNIRVPLVGYVSSWPVLTYGVYQFLLGIPNRAGPRAS
jgi:hypothetical protein